MTQKDHVEFHWWPKPADWTDALRATLPMYRWAPWFAGVMAVGSIVLLVLGQWVAGGFGLCAAVVIAAVPVIGVYSAFRANPVASSEVTAVADEHALEMMTVDGSAHTELRWPQVQAWQRTRRGYLLRTGGSIGEMYPVPHRAFESGDSDAFDALLREHVGAAED
jgi:hypothetical protein